MIIDIKLSENTNEVLENNIKCVYMTYMIIYYTYVLI